VRARMHQVYSTGSYVPDNQVMSLCPAACSCVFDLPFFFCRGADRMRVLSNLLAFAFDTVEAKPKALNLQLINSKVTYLGSQVLSSVNPKRIIPASTSFP